MKSTSEKYSPLKTPKSSEEEHIQTLCKQMLKTRIFKGTYQERRYVEGLGGYRDIVVLNNCEKELKDDLSYLRQRISKFYDDENLWIGISLPDMIGAPAGVCIWTEMAELAFGQYWFSVRSVRFRHQEVIIKLKVVRSAESQHDKEKSESGAENSDISIQSFLELFLSWKDSITKSIYQFMSQDMNKENTISALKFLSILMLSLMTASLQAVKFVGIFTLRFMHEFRLLLHTCTPIILKLLDLLGKVIGGLFIMITMVYRDIINTFRRPQQVQISAPPSYKGITNGPINYWSDNYRAPRPYF